MPRLPSFLPCKAPVRPVKSKRLSSFASFMALILLDCLAPQLPRAAVLLPLRACLSRVLATSLLLALSCFFLRSLFFWTESNVGNLNLLRYLSSPVLTRVLNLEMTPLTFAPMLIPITRSRISMASGMAWQIAASTALAAAPALPLPASTRTFNRAEPRPAMASNCERKN